MKVTSGILGSHFGLGLLRHTVQVALALGIALPLLFAAGPAAADGPYDFLVPIVLEEGRTPPKVVDPPNVHVQRQVQGNGGASITQTSNTLASNLGQSNANDTNNIALNGDNAQWFGSGSDAEGYKLTSVKMIMKSTGATPSYSVEIWSGAGAPTNKLGTLNNPTLTSTWSTVEFTASGDGINLAASTTYWLVIDSSVSNADTHIRVTTSDDDDSGGAAGWVIGSNRRFRAVGDANWGTGINNDAVKIAVIGYSKKAPSLVSAEVNGTTLVLTYDKGLDTASRTAARQFGIKFGGGALRRATAISISGRQVTLTVPEVRAGQVVTVSYTKPTRNPLKGSNDAKIDAFSDQAVKVNTAPAYGRLPESGKVRDAVYVTYTNAEGEEETVENRAASADRETLWDYFYDSCQSQRSSTTLRDYSWFNADGHRMQARNGWKWVEVQNANGDVTRTRPQTLTECASHGMYLRQQNCANAEWLRRNPHLHEGTCPTNRTW